MTRLKYSFLNTPKTAILHAAHFRRVVKTAYPPPPPPGTILAPTYNSLTNTPHSPPTPLPTLLTTGPWANTSNGIIASGWFTRRRRGGGCRARTGRALPSWDEIIQGGLDLLTLCSRAGPEGDPRGRQEGGVL